jgi:hypothetical protein
MSTEIKRIARGKFDKGLDKELDHVVKQTQEAFNKLNTGQEYFIKNVTALRELDPDTATLAQIVNAFGTLLLDLQKTGMLKVKTK